MKAFLSSTYIDLIEHRKLAIEALHRLGQEVGHMEVFGALPQAPLTASFKEIEACDIFIGIYAHRYGYILPDLEISITEAEYSHAVEHKKPIFCFIVNDDYPWPPKMIEEDTARSRLIHFKQRVRKNFVGDDFTTAEALAFKIASCIGRYLTQIIPPSQSLIAQSSEVADHRNINRVLKLRVHQAHFLTSPILYYFINATNLSTSRTIELTHIWYEYEQFHIPVITTSRPLPVRLEVDQSWETWIDAYNLPESNRMNAFENFRARISTGTIFISEANHDVPPFGFVPGGPIHEI